MTDHTPLDDANSTIRRLLHQRKCLREERDRAFEEGALSMRERAAQQLEYTPPIDSPPEHAALKAAYADAIRALPLLPDGDTTEDAITDAQDAQLPDRNGDVVNDIRIALDTRVDLTPEHRAFYAEIIHRFEGLAADRDQVRVTRDRYRDERNTARAEKAQVLQAAREATGRLPEEDLAEHGDEVSDRVGALEQQYTDLANLVHGHGEDLARLRCRFTEEDDG